MACPQQRAPAMLIDELADNMVPNALTPEEEDMAANDLARFSTECAAQTRVPEAREDAYLSYVVYRLSSIGLAQRLAKRGIPVDLVDRTLGIGPGRANALDKDIPDAKLEALMKALIARKIDPEKLPDGSWELIGAYASATSKLHQGLKPAPRG